MTSQRHRYETIGHTIADAGRRRDCTSVYQTVEYSGATRRIRVEHTTRWQGSRRMTWYVDDASRADAVALLTEIRDQGIECLGDPDRKSARIR